MKKNRKGLVIVGLIALCAVLTAGLFTLGQSPKGIDAPIDTGGAHAGVAPGGITDTPAVTVTPTAPVVNPIGITPSESTGTSQNSTNQGGTDQNNTDIPLTVIEDRPEPPELPDTAFVWEQDEEVTPEDVEAYEALDPALKNPDVRPDITPAPVQPTPTPQTPNSSTPQHGDRNANGEVYVPGFGWIKDGGPNNVRESGSDGDWNKQIGTMG
jgi:hypothetical protein